VVPMSPMCCLPCFLQLSLALFKFHFKGKKEHKGDCPPIVSGSASLKHTHAVIVTRIPAMILIIMHFKSKRTAHSSLLWL
jgi:hypothetical protein